MWQSKQKPQEDKLELEVKQGKWRKMELVVDELEWWEWMESKLEMMEDSFEWMEWKLLEVLVTMKGLGPQIDGA